MHMKQYATKADHLVVPSYSDVMIDTLVLHNVQNTPCTYV